MRLEQLAAKEPASMSTGPFGSAVSSKNFRPDGVPMIRGGNLSEDVGVRLNEKDLVYLDPQLASMFARSTARRGDLVFTCWGSVGQIGLIDHTAHHEQFVVSNKQMKFTPDVDEVDPLFLYYYLSQPTMTSLMKGAAIGSTIPGFNLGQLKQLPVLVPSISIQQATAGVLGALDDKIAANTELASRADSYIRARFSALQSESTLPVSEFLISRREGVHPGAMPPDTRYVGLEHLSRRSIWMQKGKNAATVTSGKNRFESGDILFGKLRPYFHKVAVADSSGICSTDILVLRSLIDGLEGFALAAVSSDAVIESVTSSSGGTRMPRTSWKDLAGVQVPWPGDAVARAFSKAIGPVVASVQGRLRENGTLAEIRDTLLPQLMSGKLRVRDAERSVSEVL